MSDESGIVYRAYEDARVCSASISAGPWFGWTGVGATKLQAVEDLTAKLATKVAKLLEERLHTVDPGGDDKVTNEALRARIADLKGRAADLEGQVIALEVVVSEKNAAIADLQATCRRRSETIERNVKQIDAQGVLNSALRDKLTRIGIIAKG